MRLLLLVALCGCTMSGPVPVDSGSPFDARVGSIFQIDAGSPFPHDAAEGPDAILPQTFDAFVQ